MLPVRHARAQILLDVSAGETASQQAAKCDYNTIAARAGSSCGEFIAVKCSSIKRLRDCLYTYYCSFM